MNRTDDPAVIEHRLLELAYTTDVPITVPALAYFAPCSLEDAEQVLDQLVARDRLRMEVSEDGTIRYDLPDRHKLTPRAEPDPPPPALIPSEVLPPPPALIPSEVLPPAIRDDRTASPLFAAVLSLLVPGAGQLYAGNVVTAILWFVLVGLGYMLIVPGLLLHLCCIATAAGAANRLNSSVARARLQLHGR